MLLQSKKSCWCLSCMQGSGVPEQPPTRGAQPVQSCTHSCTHSSHFSDFQQPVSRWAPAVGHHTTCRAAAQLRAAATATPALHSCSFSSLQSSTSSPCCKPDCFPPRGNWTFCPQPAFPHAAKNHNGNNWTWAVARGGQHTRMAASPQDLSQYSAAFRQGAQKESGHFWQEDLYCWVSE